MYQIAICDDEISDLQHNIQLTESIMAKAGLPCSIAAYESSQTLLSDIQTGRHFDLLLLDVLMGELDGMALAAVLKKYPDTRTWYSSPRTGRWPCRATGWTPNATCQNRWIRTASRSSAPLL